MDKGVENLKTLPSIVGCKYPEERREINHHVIYFKFNMLNCYFYFIIIAR